MYSMFSVNVIFFMFFGGYEFKGSNNFVLYRVEKK